MVLGLVSATHEALETGSPALWPVFGGARGNVPGAQPSGISKCPVAHGTSTVGAAGRNTPPIHHVSPTHACPGSHAAMGALLGVCAALVGHAERVRPGAGPLSLNIDGDLPASGSAYDAVVVKFGPLP